MDGIEFSEEIGRCVQEVGRAGAGFEGGKRELLEQLNHVGGYVIGIAEHVSALCSAGCPVLSRPGVAVLKQMMVDALIMVGGDPSRRQSPLPRTCRPFDL